MKDVTTPNVLGRPKNGGVLFRNVMHLGMGQVATTALGFVLTAAIGRSFGPSDFGILYTILTVCGFVAFAIDWGQSTYVVREMARGRSDEAEFIGSALLIGTVGSVCAAALAGAIALASGYDPRVIALAPLAVLVGLPSSLYLRFGYVFRGRDEMGLDAMVIVIGKALTVAATLAALHWGGGLTAVILAQCVGGIGSLVTGVIVARWLGIKVKAPVFPIVTELLRAGPPIVAMQIMTALQPVTELFMLSSFTSPTVVGWYGASRTIFSIAISPGLILSAACFPKLSRASVSPADVRSVLDSTARLLFVVAAFVASALYLFVDNIVSIIYGIGNFEEASLILRMNAPFLPLFCLGFLFGSAVIASGKTKELAVVGGVGLIISSISNWFLIAACQARFGNGAVALVISSGLAEIFVVIAFAQLLPRGAVSKTLLLRFFRACVASIVTVLPLLAVSHLWIMFRLPLFFLTFAGVALVTKLVLPMDLKMALGYVRDGVDYLRKTVA